MSFNDVEGKVAFISGASRGLGAGLARRYAQLGMRLVICSRSAPILPESAKVVSRSIDVRDEEGLEGLVVEAEERFGAIDLWINNAAVLEPVKPIRDVSLIEFRESIEINLLGVFIGTRAYLRHRHRHRQRMESERAPEGVLINISSGAASKAYSGWGAYCAGKAAVERLSQVVAEEEADSGLRVHSVAPGVVDTPMQDRVRASKIEDFPMVERFRGLKRDAALSSTRFVADELLALAFNPEARPDSVAVRLESEK